MRFVARSQTGQLWGAFREIREKIREIRVHSCFDRVHGASNDCPGVGAEPLRYGQGSGMRLCTALISASTSSDRVRLTASMFDSSVSIVVAPIREDATKG